MSSTHTEVKINFDGIAEISYQGIRRASVMMAFASNAASQDPPVSHTLDHTFSLQFVPSDINSEQSAALLQSFQVWVIGNALRDLVDNFSLYLTESFMAAQLIVNKTLSWGDYDKLKGKFGFDNVAEQHNRLCELLGLQTSLEKLFASLLNARNCMTHRNGIVGERDIKDSVDGALHIQWRQAEIVLSPATGEDVVIALGRGGQAPAPFDCETSVGFRFTWIDRKFLVGQRILLDNHDLSHICMSLFLATGEISRALVELGRANGMTIVERVEGNTPVSEDPAP